MDELSLMSKKLNKREEFSLDYWLLKTNRHILIGIFSLATLSQWKENWFS